jgi:tetratricopeptide (TPR) repeat protein
LSKFLNIEILKRGVKSVALLCIAWNALTGAIDVDSTKVFLKLAAETNSLEDRVSFAKKALQQSENFNDTLSIVNIYNYLGTIFQDMGVLDKATSYHIDALKLSQEISDNNGISNSLNNLGILYAKTRQYQKALEHFRLALEMKNKLPDEGLENDRILQYQSGSYNNIGLIYDQIGTIVHPFL